MKKLFFSFAVVCSLTAFQSCSPKCGHCHTETTTVNGGTTNVQKQDGGTTCGGGETENVRKQAEINCKNTFAYTTPVTGVTNAASWVVDK